MEHSTFFERFTVSETGFSCQENFDRKGFVHGQFWCLVVLIAHSVYEHRSNVRIWERIALGTCIVKCSWAFNFYRNLGIELVRVRENSVASAWAWFVGRTFESSTFVKLSGRYYGSGQPGSIVTLKMFRDLWYLAMTFSPSWVCSLRLGFQ